MHACMQGAQAADAERFMSRTMTTQQGRAWMYDRRRSSWESMLMHACKGLMPPHAGL
jgi:hypothetical protein